MESTIELSVFKKEIHFIKKDILTTGQQRNSIKITFNGKEWDKLTKFGVFKVETYKSDTRNKTLKAIRDAKEKQNITVCDTFEDYLKAVSE